MTLCIYIMEGYAFKMDALKNTHHNFALICTLCSCFAVFRISSAAVFVDTIWAFWTEALQSAKYKAACKNYLGNNNPLSVWHGCSARSYTSCTILYWIKSLMVFPSSLVSSVWHPIFHIWLRTELKQFANDTYDFPWTGIKQVIPLGFLKY